MESKLRKRLVLSVKLLIAAGLLAWLVTKVHLHDYEIDGKTAPGLLTIAGDINWLVLALGAVGFTASLLVIAARWWMLLRIQRIRIHLWEVVRLTFLGQFFNAVAPGVIGGDIVKAYYVAKHTPKTAAVLLSIFVDRVMGMTELALLAGSMVAVALLAGLETFADIRDAVIVAAVVAVAVVFILVFLLSRRFRRVLHLDKLYGRLPMAHHIARAGDAAVLYRKRIGVLFRAVLMTFGAHAFFVGAIAMCGASLGLAIPWYQYLLYIPLIYIIGSVPITPGGVGVMEAAFVHFFVNAPAVGASEVFAMALLARLVPIVCGLPGAIVAVRGAKLPKAETMEAELGLTKG
ncbi:MAG: flippase-like domain-containing protein [Phycisphaerae bacterium]|nr:flippase-like domain-containing protein [Phycisphaerae bacterium]